MSRPVWGAWIEIGYQYTDLYLTVCRAPYGARGLKFINVEGLRKQICRAPYGARGLKFTKNENEFVRIKVAPRMGRVD